MCCRYIVHLSTLQSAATAREDLQEAAQALADLSSLQLSSSDAAEALGSGSREKDAAEGSQAAASTAASAHPSLRNGADAASGTCKKPRALFLAYYNQVSSENTYIWSC